jgi:hypothetical protein
VVWRRAADVSPYPSTALVGTRCGSRQKEHPMNAESARAASYGQEIQTDEPYTYGRPASTYLSFRAVVRLTILRSKLEAVRNERTRHSMSERTI